MSEIKSKSSEKDWLDLAGYVTKETDREKLISAVEELCGALDQRRAQTASQSTPPAKKSA